MFKVTIQDYGRIHSERGKYKEISIKISNNKDYIDITTPQDIVMVKIEELLTALDALKILQPLGLKVTSI